MLGLDKLDESKQSEVKESLQTIVESKASEIAEEKAEKVISEQREALVEEYETKFEEYKEDITSKFSNFVDSVLDEELMIPEKVVRYARLGELYEDLIDQFKIRLAIDEGVLDDEVKSMLKEAKDEILTLRKDVNELTGKKIELEEDAKEMATHIYLVDKCDGLTESQKKTVMSVLEGASKEEIDRKFKVVVESLSVNEEEDKEEEDDDDDEDEKDKKDKKKEKEEDDDDDMNESSKGKIEGQNLNESDNSVINVWKSVLKSGKF
jgi:hypothetical protein